MNPKPTCLKAILCISIGQFVVFVTILLLSRAEIKTQNNKRFYSKSENVQVVSHFTAHPVTQVGPTNIVHKDYTVQNADQDFNSRYPFNCMNIDSIQIIQRNIGGGRSKSVDIGLVDGQKVVIKRLSLTKGDLRWSFRELLFLKDIIMRDQLKHPSIIKMLGFCLRHLKHESNSAFPRNPDVSAVYEYGEQFNVSQMILTPSERVRHALQLANLLNYLHTSPLGSLTIVDFKADEHFLIVNDRIKLIDLDYLNNIEFSCKFNSTEEKCPYKTTCTKLPIGQIDLKLCGEKKGCDFGTCPGSSTLSNMRRISKAFFRDLLNPDYFPRKLKIEINSIFKLISRHSLYPNQLERLLQLIADQI